MSTVESIHKAWGAVRVVMDDASELRIPSPLYRERPLRVGDEVDSAAHRDWMSSRAHGFALTSAVAYLASRPRTVYEVSTHLSAAGYDEETTDRVLSRLAREGFLNDAQFAEQWTLARGERALGTRRIAQELRKKGIDKETAAAAIAQVDLVEQQEIANTLAAKLLLRTRGKDPRDVQRKVLDALIRRGYDWDTARNAIAGATTLAIEGEDD